LSIANLTNTYNNKFNRPLSLVVMPIAENIQQNGGYQIMNPIHSSLHNHPGRRSIRSALLAAIALLPVASTVMIAEETTNSPSSDTKIQITNQYETGKTRYVHMAKCLVRSGPAEQHYATSQLEKGARVEVHLETSDGWSGIRPPPGSHNWIPASSAYLLPGGKTAEIVEDETAAWVGSETQKPRKLQWQTGLVKSQNVSVLDEEYQMANDGEKKLWYQIAPPQGEFRWVRTSQLSDVVGPTSSSTTNGATASPVQIASFESNTKAPTRNESKVALAAAQETSDGEIVWSNEAEVLQQVNRQIESEQSVVKNELRSQGIEIGTEEVEYSSAPVVAQPGMTAAEKARAKRHKAAAHQIDSSQHWNAIQESSNPKLRVGPVSSLLGLVGLSVVEAERQPGQKSMAQARHAHNAGQFHYGQSLQHVGPVGNSRLDRLPRPGRRPAVSSPQGGMSYSDPSGNDSNGEPIVPIDNNQPILSRLWSSNQPVFGSSLNNGPYANHAPVPSNGSYAMHPSNSGYGAKPPANPAYGSYDPGYPREFPLTSERIDRDWHGIRTNQSASVSNAMKDAFEDPLSEAEFGTPEIQRAMLDLSRVVSKPTEQWELDSMRRQCQTWIEQGGSAIVRGEARLLLDRIERFESLRVRTLGMMQDGAMIAANEATNRLGNTLAASAIARNGITPASAISSFNADSSSNTAVHNGLAQSVTGQGDASGWLVQVHTSQPGQPEFALTDDAGNVVSYVQSTASLNLRRYLQQPVMVHGARGYIPSLAAKQIVAERVVRLR
jgi:hypothetical protein